MRERFGLRFRPIDGAALQEIRYATELSANPFDHVALGLISIDFAKQECVLSYLERTQYDAVVIDEAHHCASLGTSGDRDDSLRRRLAEVLAHRAAALLLLTATPHDGYDRISPRWWSYWIPASCSGSTMCRFSRRMGEAIAPSRVVGPGA